MIHVHATDDRIYYKPSRNFSEISIVVVVNVMHFKIESHSQLCTSKLQVVVQTALFKVERQT